MLDYSRMLLFLVGITTKLRWCFRALYFCVDGQLVILIGILLGLPTTSV